MPTIAPPLSSSPSGMTPQPLGPNGMPDPLAKLRDIHLPQEAISDFPMAPGWWILAFILIAAMVTGTIIWRRHKQRNRYRKQALTLLDKITPGHTNAQKHVEQLNDLLKRAVIVAYPHENCATKFGDEWLDFLLLSSPKTPISDDLKAFFIHSSYAPPSIADEHSREQQQQAWDFCHHWLTHHLSEKKVKKLQGALP